MRRRVSWKRRIGRLYALMCARHAQRKLILLYHSVGGGPDATPTAAFRGHVGLLASMARLQSLHDLLAAAAVPDLAVAITFDDGYAALKDCAAAVLAEFACAATVFLNVGEIADTGRRWSKAENGYYPGEQFLTWHDVDALLAAGWHIGSHGMRHLDLLRADAATVRNELSASKLMIERRLGTPCRMFAYPWGRSDPYLRAEVRAAGYQYAFAGEHSRLTAQSDPLALPRINIAKDYSREDLAAILRGDWDYLNWVARAKAFIG